MTAAVGRDRRSGRAPAPRHAASRRDLRRRRWTGSWRAAIRLARRDALRHRGSTALILLMIGLPVLLISGTSAYLATQDITAAEAVPAAMGGAQAKILDQGLGPVVQNADATLQESGDPSTVPAVAGRVPGTPWTAAQLAQLTAAQVVPVGYPELVSQRGGDLLRVRALASDAVDASGLATQVSGRLPAGPNEVAVTEVGVAAGLPASGEVTLQRADGSTQTLRVTGVATATDDVFRPVDLVVGSAWIPAGASPAEFLVLRPDALTWADVQQLNRYGLVVLSKAVLADPAVASGTDIDTDSNAVGRALVVLVCLALLLETTLLAGPAFAVSAARRRRSLALIASNGADQSQLTRYVVAQGLVLGGVAAITGCLVGTAAGWGVTRAWDAFRDGTEGRPPLDAYAALTGTVLLAAVVAAMVAAAIPARGAARLALVGVLSGQDHRDRGSSRVAVVGGVVVAVGASGVAVAALALRSTSQLYLAGAGGALMVLGALPVIPSLLALLSRAFRHAPIPLRMASRDAARSHSRSSSAIAATLVAVAVLTILATANTSDEAQQRRDYRPRTVFGHGSVQVFDDGGQGAPRSQPTVDLIRREHPNWQLEPRGRLGTYEYRDGSGTGDVVALVPPHCTAARAIANLDAVDPTRPVGMCNLLGSNDGAVELAVLPQVALRAELELTAAQRALLTHGGILVSEPLALRGSSARLALGTFQRPQGDSRRVTRELQLPAGVLSRSQVETLLPYSGGQLRAALVLTETATRLKLPLDVQSWEVVDPTGSISRRDEEAINEHADIQLEVERGYQSIRFLIPVLIGLAAVLVAVAALISTALAQVESEPDLSTMGAVGASPGIRRRLAAAQALLVALTGSLLGIALGLGPGVAIAVALTTDTGYANGAPLSPPDPVVLVPWLGLLLVAVLVPLVAASVAAVSVRPGQALTRRRE